MKLEAKKSRRKEIKKTDERSERVGGHRPHGEESKDNYFEVRLVYMFVEVGILSERDHWLGA
jgi:hypothetical protein